MNIGKIPIHISPFFFVVAAAIGWLASHSLVGIAVWMVVIFVSILIHELGHATAALAFGQSPRIELVAFGGLTVPEGPTLSKGKEFLVIFAGPFFGFMLFGVATALLQLPFIQQPVIVGMLAITAFINLFWTAINLLPMLPLDGGQLVRVVLEKVFGSKGRRYAMAASMVIAGIGVAVSLVYGSLIMAVLFCIFAFQNFESFRSSKNFTEVDQDHNLHKLIEDTEEMLTQGKLNEARATLEQLRSRAQKGILFTIATQYLAHIAYKKHDLPKVYALLQPIYKDVSPLELVMLQEAAAIENDYDLVHKISPECFQVVQSPEIALRAAKAAAYHGEEEAVVGWLSSAKHQGVANIEEFVQDPIFDSVASSPIFRKFLEQIRETG